MTAHPPMKVRVSSACPACSRRHVIDLQEVLETKPMGMYSGTRGGQKKVTNVREAWTYHCTACGTGGSAQAPDLPLTELMGRPIGSCGHTALGDHLAGDGHDTAVCPGCCPACQAIKDRRLAEQ